MAVVWATMAATGIKKHAGGAQQEIDTHQVNQIQFEAGRLKYYEENWRNITTDPVVLDMVKHCHFDIDIPVDSLPSQTHVVNCIFNENEKKIVDKEVESLLQLKVIKQVEHEDSEFISPIFNSAKRMENTV